MSEPSLSLNNNRANSNTSRDSTNGSFNNNQFARNQQPYIRPPVKPAYFYDHQLIGDDFLMAMAVSDLRCTSERSKYININRLSYGIHFTVALPLTRPPQHPAQRSLHIRTDNPRRMRPGDGVVDAHR